MHARDIIDVHIWAPSTSDAYREQITDETSGQTSSVLVLDQPEGRPADARVRHQRDRQRARLGRRLGYADGLRLRDRPLRPLRRPSRRVLRSGPDVLRLVQLRQLGRLAADPDLRRDVRRRLAPAALGGGLRHRRQGRGARQLLRRPDRLHGVRRPVLHLPVVLVGRAGVQLRRQLPRTRSTTSAGRTSSHRTPTCPEDGVFPGKTYCDTIIR